MVSQSLPNQYLADPDVQLMLRVATNDHKAFEQLVERYQDRLIGFFYHLLGDRTVSEDLAQDAFLRVYRARERYKASARFSTWLFRIAHNLASNQIRGLAKRRREVSLAAGSSGSHEVKLEDRVLAERSALMPTRMLVSRELQSQVRDALDGLAERQKMAVLLHKFEGMSYEDIGSIMSMNAVAVKSLLARAREKLKTALEKHT
ncbi:MAG: sigma-70 family RNA polymerase sigma factor [Fuerstiella sp.]|nr:sigma-70 family RNA polymerase sigma factor [Fuerstiella sp.]